jgi:flavin reductase (DIM6/NTAB) family NADH-FMN oxidoreductase RutF
LYDESISLSGARFMPVTADELREGMRLWATGVTLVTARHAGVQHGMTVSSFTSVSLEPALVLVSLERSARTRDLAVSSMQFAVTVLSAKQQAISDRFAGRETENEDRFAGLPIFQLPSGIPVVVDALAYFDCQIEHLYEASTHTLMVGQVQHVIVDASSPADGDPLIYFNRAYRMLCKPPEVT